jgi:hypothetical protein
MRSTDLIFNPAVRKEDVEDTAIILKVTGLTIEQVNPLREQLN